MAMVAGQSSTLNPNAPVFIPAMYREVEDFSPEWWELVKSCTWYRDYWLSQHPVESFNYDHEQDEFDHFEDEFEMVWLSEDEEEKTKPAVINNGGSVGVTKNSKIARDAIANAVIKELNLSIPKKYGKEMSTVKSTVTVNSPKYQMKALIKKSAAFAPRLIHQPR